MISAAELTAKIKQYNPSVNESLIQKAYLFSKAGHGNQKRHSGDPYFSHPLAVAEILVDLKLDEASIVAALFHDLVEDTEITLDEIEKDFGEQVAKLVDGVTKLSKIESVPVSERVAENFRKLTLAMSEDIRVLLIKLADRLHNMRTIFYMPSKERKIKKAKESLEIYAPLAARIGLNKIKDELQELSFEIIDPETRGFVVERLNELHEKKKDFIEKITENLSEKLRAENIDFEISGREKKPYSIWQKMKRQNVGFHHLHDIMAFRIVVSDIAECYRVLGIVNSSHNMIPNTFRDYISTPKDNGYRSLHLAILGPFNKKIELQIRDRKMHEIAELGVAAHWLYKDKKPSKSSVNKIEKNTKKETEQYQWIRDLISLFENAERAGEVLEHNKLQMHKNEVFCFTPNGDIFNVPLGATAIDFAYAIHSGVGNSCVGAKINGVISPLRQKLENGDQVEIITSKNAKPSSNWLQFVTTTKAKSAIKHFIRNDKFDEHCALGRTILTKFFVAKSLELNDKMLEKIITQFQAKSVDDLFVRVAEGIVARQDILNALYPDHRDESKPARVIKSASHPDHKKKKEGNSLPIDGLVTGMSMHYAGCCNPIPGDEIVGVINTGTGVTIHNQLCHNLRNIALNPQRIIDLCWKSGNSAAAENLYSSRIRVVVENKSGSLADVTSVIARKQVNIINIKVTNRNIDYFELFVDIEVKNTEHLEEIISALRISRKIVEVERIMA